MKWSPRFEAVFKRNLDLEKIGEKKNSDIAILMDRAWDRTFGIQKKEDKK
ncbi:hypothetical protein [Leptospira levettii]|nr:hypothetical protein [Leptospira levettii]